MTSPRNWKVLVVDDEPDSVEAMADVLEFHGASIWQAGDGREAIQILEKEQPTLVLTDLSMPDLDGWGLLSYIRKTPGLEHVPVIAVTAHAMRGDRERALNGGFTAYLSKPISIYTFIEDVADCLISALSIQTRDTEA